MIVLSTAKQAISFGRKQFIAFGLALQYEDEKDYYVYLSQCYAWVGDMKATIFIIILFLLCNK